MRSTLLLPALLALCAASLPGGDPAEDLAAIERQLEDAPEDPALLERAASAALAAEEGDVALWYVALAREQLGADGDAKALARLEALRTEIAPPAVDEAFLDDYAERLFRLAKRCESRKLYANAVDLLETCRGTRFEGDAEARLARLFSRDKAVEALLESGIDVPLHRPPPMSPEKLAKEDAAHSAWEDAWELKGRFYTVRTNMGYEMASAIADAMEQVNRFYRQVFDYKKRGGSMRRCVLSVYRTRAEFDAHEGMGDQPSVKGFFSPSENNVSTYDPRTEPAPRPLSFLWATLFHESSHQFTRAVWPNQIPAWLNEGTASYFEGAQLLPNGTVEFNGIPDQRLRNLVLLLARGSPSLRDVVTFFRPGSYPGDYYPFGWGLVYFCHNYEDESCERPYLAVYREFMESYKGGGQHDVLERFVQHFVKDAAVPGVTTFEEFEALWAGWMRELHDLHFGGPEKADVLLARARRQRAAGKPEAAVESLRWALRKRPGDPAALAELGAVYAELERDDAALYAWRQLARRARAAADPEAPLDADGRTATELLGLATAGAAEVEEGVAEALTDADEALVADALAAARRLDEGGFPRAGLHLLGVARRVLGGHGSLAAEARAIAGETLDLRRWRRLPVDDDLAAWSGTGDWSALDAEIACAPGGGLALLEHHGPAPPGRFRFEARVHLDELGEMPLVGLSFGAGLESEGRLLAFAPEHGLAGLVTFAGLRPELARTFPAVREDREAKTVLLALEVHPDRCALEVDGKPVAELPGGSEEHPGRVGLFAQGAGVRFAEVRLRY